LLGKASFADECGEEWTDRTEKVGPSRQNRPWLWATLLLSFIPFWFVSTLCWIVNELLGPGLAFLILLICLFGLIVETMGGIYYGMMAHSKCRQA
jgi:hypothetical protein